MKRSFAILTALGCLAAVVPATVTPADAYVVRKVVREHRGVLGHGCRTVRTVKNGVGGRRVVVRKVCG